MVGVLRAGGLDIFQNISEQSRPGADHAVRLFNKYGHGGLACVDVRERADPHDDSKTQSLAMPGKLGFRDFVIWKAGGLCVRRAHKKSRHESGTDKRKA